MCMTLILWNVPAMERLKSDQTPDRRCWCGHLRRPTPRGRARPFRAFGVHRGRCRRGVRRCRPPRPIVAHGAPDKILKRVFADVGDPARCGPGRRARWRRHPVLVALVAGALAPGLAADAWSRPPRRCRTAWGRRRNRCPSPPGSSVAEVPGGLVLDAEGALELVRAHPLPGLAHQVDGDEPLAQRKVGAVHDGARGHAEHGPVARAALPLAPASTIASARASPHRMQATPPGQRTASSASRQLSSVLSSDRSEKRG